MVDRTRKKKEKGSLPLCSEQWESRFGTGYDCWSSSCLENGWGTGCDFDRNRDICHSYEGSAIGSLDCRARSDGRAWVTWKAASEGSPNGVFAT